MRALITIIILFPLILKGQENQKPEVEMGRYIGFMVGQQFKDSDIPLSEIIKGIEAVVDGDAPNVNRELCRLKFMELERKRFQEISRDNLKKSEDLISQIRHLPNTIEIVPQKLYVKMITPGEGTVKLQESGLFHVTCETNHGITLINTRSGEPTKLDLITTVEGFALGVKEMKIGERRKLYIHPDLGYKDTAWVDPNVALIIDVELLSVE